MPDGEFNGRTVLITGAGGGIGAAIARAFADQGATLVLNDLRPPGSEKAPGAWVVGDLRHPQVVRDLIATARERTGRIDVLVNAAGIQLRKPAVDVEEEEWQILLSVNLSAAYALARAAAPALIEQKGAIINISSLSATRVLPNIVPYGATKAALTQLSNGLAVELGPSGVRVNAIAPGHIVTPMTEQNLAKPEVSGRLLPRIPLGRFGTADEVAQAAIFLASQRARYITGAVLAVDGGYAAT
jgi:3-oxoacyl-[acyl-carrier protein] reductase